MLNRFKDIKTPLWLRVILFVVAYVATALLSREISFTGASYPTIWFPSGVFVAFLLLNEIRSWPVFLLAALPACLIYGLLSRLLIVPFVLIYISGTLEAVTGAWLVRRFDEKAAQFLTPSNILNLIVLSAMISTAVSTTISAAVMGSLAHGFFYWPAWQIGWASHALGILVATPLILSWTQPKSRLTQKGGFERIIEQVILIAGLVACSLYIFVGNYNLNRDSYLVVPFLVWVALRFGLRGTTFSGLIITILASYGTAQQLGGFTTTDLTIAPSTNSLGLFLAIILVTCYILATVWEQGKRTENALRESEERYRLLIENQGEGVGILDPNDVFTFANPAANQIFGVENLVGRRLREFTSPKQLKFFRKQTRFEVAGQKTTCEIEIFQPGGKRCSLLVSATPEQNTGSKFNGTFAVFHDITERKQAEIALLDSRARFQILFDHSPIPIWEEDFSRVKLMIDGLSREGIEDFREYFNEHQEAVKACYQLIRVLGANQAAMQLFGITEKAQFLAQTHKLIQRGPNDVFIEELIAIAEGKTEFEVEGPNDIVEGTVRYHYVRWAVAPGYEKNYRLVIVSIIDVTERKQTEERMRYMSTHDLLTGLYNRNFFETEMERLQDSRLEPVNVMAIDVNGMKAANDTLGHTAGDELLRRSAQVLRMSFRKEDIIARIGGDEFVVLFHGSISIQDAILRVKDCLAEHNHWYEGPALSLAIGAASGNKGSQLLELYKKADQQMYKEKIRSKRSRADGAKS